MTEASGDKTIKKWKGDKCIKSISAHTDVVRALLLHQTMLISCSNDATIKIWNVDLTLVQTLYGHTSFVYQISILPTGEIVSCGEDSTVRVWKEGELVDTIKHPCVSVWTVCALANGDICSGGSDGIVRAFSRDAARVASIDELGVFTESVSKNAAPAGMVGDVDVSKLADESVLLKDGTKPDQVVMVNRNGTPIAFQWTGGVWVEIGAVVSTTNKKLLGGKEFDFVFDINVSDGGALLKLGYNKTDNPYMAAQVFIEENELSQSYLEEIAGFIITNSAGVVLGEEASSGAPSDPYTGYD